MTDHAQKAANEISSMVFSGSERNHIKNLGPDIIRSHESATLKKYREALELAEQAQIANKHTIDTLMERCEHLEGVSHDRQQALVRLNKARAALSPAEPKETT